MSDDDLRTLIERLQTLAASYLGARRRLANADPGVDEMTAMDAALANDAAMAVNELLAIREILRVSAHGHRARRDPAAVDPASHDGSALCDQLH